MYYTLLPNPQSMSSSSLANPCCGAANAKVVISANRTENASKDLAEEEEERDIINLTKPERIAANGMQQNTSIVGLLAIEIKNRLLLASSPLCVLVKEPSAGVSRLDNRCGNWVAGTSYRRTLN